MRISKQVIKHFFKTWEEEDEPHWGLATGDVLLWKRKTNSLPVHAVGCSWYIQYSSQLDVSLKGSKEKMQIGAEDYLKMCPFYMKFSSAVPPMRISLSKSLAIHDDTFHGCQLTFLKKASLSLPHHCRTAVLLCWEEQAGDLSSLYHTSGVQLALSALWSPGCYFTWLFDPVNDFAATWLYLWLCVKSYSNRRPRFFFSGCVTNICRVHATYLTYAHMEWDLGSCLKLAKLNIVSATSFYCSLSLQKFYWLFEKEIIPVLWHVGVSRALQYACCLELDVTDRLPH